MKVTKIEQQKNNKDRWSIFLDGEFAFGINGEEVLAFKLYTGKDINPEELKKMIIEKDYSKAKDIALNFLSYRARSEKELRNKLISKEYDEEIIDRVVDFLKKYEYINDEKFAKSYIRDRIRLKPVGRKKLFYDLRQKGIKSGIIDHVLDNMDLNEVNNAEKLIKKKISNRDELDLKKKQKIYQFLLGKGFSYDTIRKAFEMFLA